MTDVKGSQCQREPTDSGLRLRLMNGFEVSADGRPLQFPATACRLIAYLGLRRRPVARAKIAGVLWGEATNERAHASLRSTLWRIRQVNDRLVRSDRASLELADDVSVDINVVLDAAHGLPGDDLLRTVPASWLSFELLPDWYDDWIVFERERARLAALVVLEALSERHLADGDCPAAIESAIAAIELEPLRESAHRALIAAHLADGNAADALRQFRSFSAALLCEIGVAPSDRLVDLLDGAGLNVGTG